MGRALGQKERKGGATGELVGDGGADHEGPFVLSLRA